MTLLGRGTVTIRGLGGYMMGVSSELSEAMGTVKVKVDEDGDWRDDHLPRKMTAMTAGRTAHFAIDGRKVEKKRGWWRASESGAKLRKGAVLVYSETDRQGAVETEQAFEVASVDTPGEMVLKPTSKKPQPTKGSAGASKVIPSVAVASSGQVSYAMRLLSRFSDRDWHDSDAGQGSPKPTRKQLEKMSARDISAFIDSIKDDLR